MNIYTEYGNIIHMSISRGHREKVTTDPGVSKLGLWRALDYQGAPARARRKADCPIDSLPCIFIHYPSTLGSCIRYRPYGT